MTVIRHLAGLALLASALAATPAGAETTLASLKERGTARLGFANETPFSFAQPDGSLSGIDYDVLTAVLGELGIKKIDGVLTPFGSLIPGLKADRFDVIGTGLYIRPDRCRQVAFSKPTLAVGSALIVPTGNPKKLHSFADVAAQPALKIGYVVGGSLMIPQAGGVKPEQLVSFPDVLTSVSALKARRVDAVLRTHIDAVQVVRQMGEQMGEKSIEVAQPFAMPEKDGKPMVNHIGFALRTEDKALLGEINTRLKAFLGSPEHLKLLEKYSIIGQAYPIVATTASLCRE